MTTHHMLRTHKHMGTTQIHDKATTKQRQSATKCNDKGNDKDEEHMQHTYATTTKKFTLMYF